MLCQAVEIIQGEGKGHVGDQKECQLDVAQHKEAGDFSQQWIEREESHVRLRSKPLPLVSVASDADIPSPVPTAEGIQEGRFLIGGDGKQAGEEGDKEEQSNPRAKEKGQRRA